MPLQESGAISLSQVEEEFGNIIDGGAFLSEYWGVEATVPKRGQEISLSDFYGTVNLQMTVTVSNTDPNLELVASDAGRSYVAAQSVLLTTSTASEFGYSQSGSIRGYSTWYKGNLGPYYQIGSEIKYSDAGTTVPDTQFMTASNASAFGYVNANEAAVDGHVRYTNSNNAYPQETWVSETSPYEMKTRTTSIQDYGISGVAVTTANAGTADYWFGTSGTKYVITTPDNATSPDRNGYYQWRISGTTNYYWSLGNASASPAASLKERTPTASTVDVTVSEAPYMGYEISDPAVTEDGHTKWTKGGSEYWARATDNKFYTRTVDVVSYNDINDQNNYWKIEQVGGANPYKLTVSLNGTQKISYYSTEPTTTSVTINGITVTRGSQRTGQAWAYDYKLFNNGDAYNQYWQVGNYYPFGYIGTKVTPIPANAGTINATGPNQIGIAGYTSLFGNFYDDAMTRTEITVNGVTLKRGDFVRYDNTGYGYNVYKLGEPYNTYPATWGISASGNVYNYSGPIQDTKITYSYSSGITDSQRASQTVYTYSSQLELTKNVTTYQYDRIYEIRPEVLGIYSTPEFNYDNARQSLYRASTTSLNYSQKLYWPESIAYSYNWRNGRTINNYYLTRMEVDNAVILEGGQETLVTSGSLINTGNNTPQRLVFTPNAEAAPEELTDYFFTLYRNDQGSSSPVNLGYVAPMNGSYPTMSLSGNTLTLGNLAANETFRLKWHGIQGAKLSVAGATATVDGTSSNFTSTTIPTLAISGGDNNRRGFDLYLERKVNTSPEAWAVIRCWEFFQDTNKSNLFGSNNYQIAGCDFLDIYKYGRS
jgi:hypothetical protein